MDAVREALQRIWAVIREVVNDIGQLAAQFVMQILGYAPELWEWFKRWWEDLWHRG